MVQDLSDMDDEEIETDHAESPNEVEHMDEKEIFARSRIECKEVIQARIARANSALSDYGTSIRELSCAT